MFKINFLIVVFLIINRLNCSEIKGFDDTVLFDIRWPGELKTDPESNDVKLPENDLQTMTITTGHQEKYKCYLPNVIEKEAKRAESYSGPTPIELLKPLFKQSACSYRIESYWTYEICHGRYIRQYHEDREGKKMRLQEYYLGKWDKEHLLYLIDKSKTSDDHHISSTTPVKKIDGVNLPYLELEMGNGTLCDLNDKPRSTKLLYVCYPHGKHEVYSLKETSTCIYEVIVLSPLLCEHPKYAPSNTEDNIIECRPIGNAPSKPRGLLEMKADSWKYKHGARQRGGLEDSVRIEIHTLGERDELTTPSPQPETPADISPVKAFLSGRDCLHGGTGWWKYEFCYGKTVQQYHVHRDGSKTTILLGKFNREKHIEWLNNNPHKRPKNSGVAQKQFSHFYSEGAVCEKTGKPRQTIVKLKCLEGNPGAVSLYLLEPKYCEYVLGVESPLICDILEQADENGLVPLEVMDQLTQGQETVAKDEKKLTAKEEKDNESEETNSVITS